MGNDDERDTRNNPTPEQAHETLEIALIGGEQSGRRIRRVWHDGRWFYSVIDILGVLTDTNAPRRYWSDLKRQLSETEGFNQLYEKVVQLKMPSRDGKNYLTDAADTETILRIVQSVSSPKVEPLKQWLAQVGTERLDEQKNTKIDAGRLRKQYKKQGYSDQWIDERLKNTVIRNTITEVWQERGAEEGREFAILTDTLHTGTFDVTVDKHREIKQLKPRNNLRDSMTMVELALTGLAEVTSTAIHEARDSQGFIELQRDAHKAGDIAGDARRNIEEATGQPVVSPVNYKQLRQERQRELQPPLLDAPETSD